MLLLPQSAFGLYIVVLTSVPVLIGASYGSVRSSRSKFPVRALMANAGVHHTLTHGELVEDLVLLIL